MASAFALLSAPGTFIIKVLVVRVDMPRVDIPTFESFIFALTSAIVAAYSPLGQVRTTVAVLGVLLLGSFFFFGPIGIDFEEGVEKGREEEEGEDFFLSLAFWPEVGGVKSFLMDFSPSFRLPATMSSQAAWALSSLPLACWTLRLLEGKLYLSP